MSNQPLSHAVRADLFSHLAAMEKAGLPADKAFALLKLPGAEQRRLTDMRRQLGRGLDIAAAGARSGLFTPFESRLLHAALAAGSPAATYRRLADMHASKARQAAAIRSGMAMPLLVFVIALLVQPLPALAAGSLTAGGYLLQALRPLLALGALYFLALRFSHWHEGGAPSWTRTRVDALLLRVPLFGAMHLRRNVADFLQSLALLLEAGMPMFDALPDAVASIANSVVRAEFATIGPRMAQGATLTQSIATLALPGTEPLIGFVRAGEAGGRLPEMLQRYADGEAAAVYNFRQQVAAWLPRVIYSVIALWIAYGILTGGAFMPHLPADLR